MKQSSAAGNRWLVAAGVSLLAHAALFAGTAGLYSGAADSRLLPDMIPVALESAPVRAGPSVGPVASGAPFVAPAPVIASTAAPAPPRDDPRSIRPVPDRKTAEGPDPAADKRPEAQNPASAAPGTAGRVPVLPGPITPPYATHRADPVLPAEARATPAGSVRLRVEILPSGRAGRIVLAQGTGRRETDAAVVRSIAAWRFEPARDQATGTPVAAWTAITIFIPHN